MSQSYFVTGIGTEVGKTVVSALLVRALEAHYWKPVQSGDLHHTDTDKIRTWAELPQDRIRPERWSLKMPASPHASAAAENVRIDLADFQLPQVAGNLIVEGAGGLFVPLNDEHTMLDLIVKLGLPVVLVSRHYLGSINHTLLSLAALRQRGISDIRLVFNGDEHPTTEAAIRQHGNIEPWFRLPELTEPSAATLGMVLEQLRVAGGW
jgi:dethiobiotin synthetase